MSAPENRPQSTAYTIRPCTFDDEQAAIAVCLRTGDAGNDASALYNDPHVLGHRYVSPYLHLSPELAFVLEDPEGSVCGYVLAALHSDAFYRRYVDEWLPKMRQLHSQSSSDDRTDKDDGNIIEGFYNDSLESFRLFEDYPSHLHIDLLPGAQGKGYGTQMIHRIEEELKQRGSSGVHLGMAPSNTRALHFYTKLGFKVLLGESHALWLGKPLSS